MARVMFWTGSLIASKQWFQAVVNLAGTYYFRLKLSKCIESILQWDPHLHCHIIYVADIKDHNNNEIALLQPLGWPVHNITALQQLDPQHLEVFRSAPKGELFSQPSPNTGHNDIRYPNIQSKRRKPNLPSLQTRLPSAPGRHLSHSGYIESTSSFAYPYPRKHHLQSHASWEYIFGSGYQE